MNKKENETIIENRGYFRPDEVVMSQVMKNRHAAVAVYERTSHATADSSVPNAVYLP